MEHFKLNVHSTAQKAVAVQCRSFVYLFELFESDLFLFIRFELTISVLLKDKYIQSHYKNKQMIVPQ